MKEPADIYADTIHRQAKVLYAAWPPEGALKLGDYGTMDDNVFRRAGNVHDLLGLTFKVRKGAGQADVEYKTQKSVTMRAVAKGGTDVNASVSAKAKLYIDFQKKESIYFRAAGCTYDEIDNITQLERALSDAYLTPDPATGREWRLEWVVVVMLARAAATTAIVSQAGKTGVCLEAKVATVPQVDLGQAGAEILVGSDTTGGMRTVARGGLTPLIGLRKLAPNNRFSTAWRRLTGQAPQPLHGRPYAELPDDVQQALATLSRHELLPPRYALAPLAASRSRPANGGTAQRTTRRRQ